MRLCLFVSELGILVDLDVYITGQSGFVSCSLSSLAHAFVLMSQSSFSNELMAEATCSRKLSLAIITVVGAGIWK